MITFQSRHYDNVLQRFHLIEGVGIIAREWCDKYDKHSNKPFPNHYPTWRFMNESFKCRSLDPFGTFVFYCVVFQLPTFRLVFFFFNGLPRDKRLYA